MLSNNIENTYRSVLVKDALDSLCANILVFLLNIRITTVVLVNIAINGT